MNGLPGSVSDRWEGTDGTIRPLCASARRTAHVSERQITRDCAFFSLFGHRGIICKTYPNCQAGGVLRSGRIVPTGSVGGPETALRHANISRNGRGSQQVRPREVTLRCLSPPSVGMGCKVACPPRAAPVVAHADHPRGRCAVPLSARRATSTARRTGPLRSRRASPTPTTLGSHRPPRCAARANAPPPPT